MNVRGIMGMKIFLNVLKNELIKILKNRITLAIIIIAIISLFLAYFLTGLKEEYVKSTNPDYLNYIDSEEEIKDSIKFSQKELLKKGYTEAEYKTIEARIIAYKYFLENDVSSIFNAAYKNILNQSLNNEFLRLFSIDKSLNKDKFDEQKAKIEKIWNLLLHGSFEEYVKFNIEEIEKSYSNAQISLEEYNAKIKEQEDILQYEIDKYSEKNSQYKNELLTYYQSIDNKIDAKYSFTNYIYLNEQRIKYLENQKLIIKYRLKNNIAPCYTIEQYKYNPVGYCRYTYNNYASTISVFFIGLLGVVLGSICIRGEVSKGTIKTLFSMPIKRYKILIAKILSIIIVMVLAILILSQISILIGNIIYKGATNEYLYVHNSEVKVINTWAYETLYYLLKLPEIIVYMLIGVACSVLFRSKFASIVPITIYVGITAFIQSLFLEVDKNVLFDISFLRYFPFENIKIVDKVLHIETYAQNLNVLPTSLIHAIITISLMSILALVIAFDGINKKEI